MKVGKQQLSDNIRTCTTTCKLFAPSHEQDVVQLSNSVTSLLLCAEEEADMAPLSLEDHTTRSRAGSVKGYAAACA